MLAKMKYLPLTLCEDIEKAKLSGDFERAERLIEIRLHDAKTPESMKERLLLEKEVIRRLPDEYPYEINDALRMIQKEIPDFTMEELEYYMDRGDADWYMVNGKVHLQERFFASMKKVFPEIAERAHEKRGNADHLNQNIADMKKNGSAAWRIRLRHTFRIKDEAFRPGKVRIHLPVVSECMNMKEVRILKTDPGNAYISDAHHHARTVCFEVNLKENRPFSIEYEYVSSVNYVNPQPEEAMAYSSVSVDQADYDFLVSDAVKKLAHELAGNETNRLIIARRFYDFVTEHVTYSFMRQYITLGMIPDYCISRLRGDCGVQALLFIALCLSAGIPAKWQSGKYVTPESAGNHDWAMFYIEPWGWMFADCSFGGSAYRANAYERHDFYFGNLDPFRMAANHGILKEFDPPKKHWRIDPYDNQSGEAEYEERGLDHDEVISECEVIQMSKIL